MIAKPIPKKKTSTENYTKRANQTPAIVDMFNTVLFTGFSKRNPRVESCESFSSIFIRFVPAISFLFLVSLSSNREVHVFLHGLAACEEFKQLSESMQCKSTSEITDF